MTLPGEAEEAVSPVLEDGGVEGIGKEGSSGGEGVDADTNGAACAGNRGPVMVTDLDGIRWQGIRSAEKPDPGLANKIFHREGGRAEKALSSKDEGMPGLQNGKPEGNRMAAQIVLKNLFLEIKPDRGRDGFERRRQAGIFKGMRIRAGIFKRPSRHGKQPLRGTLQEIVEKRVYPRRDGVGLTVESGTKIRMRPTVFRLPMQNVVFIGIPLGETNILMAIQIKFWIEGAGHPQQGHFAENRLWRRELADLPGPGFTRGNRETETAKMLWGNEERPHKSNFCKNHYEMPHPLKGESEKNGISRARSDPDPGHHQFHRCFPAIPVDRIGVQVHRKRLRQSVAVRVVNEAQPDDVEEKVADVDGLSEKAFFDSAFNDPLQALQRRVLG